MILFLLITDKCFNFDGILNLTTKKDSNYFITSFKETPLLLFEDLNKKSITGYPMLRLLQNINSPTKIDFRLNGEIDRIVTTSRETPVMEFVPGHYDIYINGISTSNIDLKLGGSYNLIVSETSPNNFVSIFNLLIIF